jgi:hypothetical protein
MNPQSAVPARSDFVAYAEQFNHTLKVLTCDLARRYPNDAMVYRAEKRIMAVVDFYPLFVIDEVGPYLYKYRKQIFALHDANAAAAAEAFFMDNTYDTDLKASVNQEKADMVSYIIPKAKECARSLPALEKQQYIDAIVSLLDDYIEYLSEKTAGGS